MILHHYANGLPLFAYAAGAATRVRTVPLYRERYVQKQGLLIIPLVEPEAFHTRGLVASAREPLAPLSRALFTFAASLDLSSEIERRIAQTG